ncbi:MAG TPA: ATP-binding protein [Thermoleophilia bacterium]|nr:ATP-binding protein [Thermoleophilia bacterium]HQG03263.1 ATP-binding protein [Thermoleophilia bacterium]HQG54957.1 ATP-binding protein [Thermoleophilia bacterium]HQJ98036.1 ATP-binding protein [Thermoleophilia bacterium]
MAANVEAEIRGGVCIVRCAGDDGDELVRSLDDELTRCRSAGAHDVVVDLQPAAGIDAGAVAVLSRAAHAFHDAGGEFVVICEDRDLRERLAAAGLSGAPSGASAGPALEGAEHVALPDRPRWQFEFSFPADCHELPNARRRIVALAEICGMEGTPLFELHVAAGEALANAFRHGSPQGADDDITVRFFCYPDEVAVEVGDRGAGMDAAPICAPEPTQAAGRGIHFMRTMADDVLFACGPTGTRVLLTKKLR